MIRPLLLLRAKRGAASDGRAPATDPADIFHGLVLAMGWLQSLVFQTFLEGVAAGLQEELSDEALRRRAWERTNAVQILLAVALTERCDPVFVEGMVAAHTPELTESR